MLVPSPLHVRLKWIQEFCAVEGAGSINKGNTDRTSGRPNPGCPEGSFHVWIFRMLAQTGL